jgi:hypothetical protein
MQTTVKHRVLITVLVACVALGPASVTRAIPPDPDNAALVYYQAFLLAAQLDDGARDALFDFGRGEEELTDEIRQSAERCRTAIEYATAAADLKQCNWGLRFSLGFSLSLPHLSQVRYLSHAILADARILAADGNYPQAFARCLTVKKMGQHMSDETIISLLVGIALDAAANRCIRDLLGSAHADLETLGWLKTELAVMSGKAPSMKHTMEYERETAMEIMRPEKIHLLVEALAGSDAEITPAQAAQMSEELLARNRDYYSRFITSLEMALSTPGGYPKRYQKLTELADQLAAAAATDPAAVLTAAMAPGMNKAYSLEVLGQANDNATWAAVDICIIRAQTGQLPAELPADLPGDPFSGQDFEYERTDDGFVLRCRGRDLVKDMVHEYACVVK